MKDSKPTDAPQETPPPTKVERETAPDPEEQPKKPKYEFKILPADPKNSFDFEDVADK